MAVSREGAGLAALASATRRPFEEVLRHHVLEGVLRRLARAPEVDRLALRGGMLARHWAAPTPRPADDIDFLARERRERDEARDVFARILERRADDGVSFEAPGAETIWAETDFPGTRLTVPARFDDEALAIQIDIGAGDPLDAWPEPIPYRPLLGAPILVRSVSLETSLAWKTHGLFEFAEGHWRPKDLFDIALLSRGNPISAGAFRRALSLAFSSRHTPLSVIDRLFEGSFGHSRGTRKGWRRFRSEHPERGAPQDPAPVIQEVADFLRPHVAALKSSKPAGWRGSSARFPVIENEDELRGAIAGCPEFRVYQRQGFRVYTYELERTSSFPSPLRASSATEARRFALRRECRGLTFDDEGRLIARKLHKFFHLDDREESLARTFAAERPRILEKLDGSMIAPMLLKGRLVWTTRRGFSEIADQASAHALAHPGDYLGFVRGWLEAGWTPIFEWCSREHRLVLDYPESRLVLIALRERRSGAYRPYEELSALATEAGIPVVASLGFAPADVRELAASVEGRRGCEGVVLLFADGRMLKLKSRYYRQIHHIKERPGEPILLWRAAAHGYMDDALAALAGERRRELAAFAEAFEAALARRACWLQGIIDRAREGSRGCTQREAKRRLALGLPDSLAPIEKALVFRLWRGGEAAAVLRGELRKALGQQGGLGLARVLLGAELAGPGL